MKCTINDVNLSFDTKGRLRKTILRVSGHDAHKAYVLAAFLYDAGFNQFLLNSIKPEDVIKGETISFDNITPEDCLKINQNKLASLFREYYVNHYLSVHNSTTNKGFGGLNGFTSAAAKNVAKSHHASLIIDEYQKELNKNPKDRRKNIEIIKAVNARIEKTFNKRAEDFALYVIEHSEYSLEAKAYAKKCVNVFTQINELNKKLDKYSESIDNEVLLGKTFAEEIKRLKAQKITKETKKHIIELIKSYKEVIAKVESIQKERDKVLEEGSELNVEKRLLLQNLINQFADTTDSKHGIRLRNYANLFAQSLYNSNEWYFQVFNTKQMTSINNSFNNIDDIESYIEEENDNSENNFSKYNGESIDETTKSWEDSLYKNFTQAVDGKLKVILSTLPKLEEKFNPTDDVQAIDTNNELGVQTYMDYQFVSVQIFTFGDFSSVESLIRSLDEKSKQIKSLYGIGKLVQMMKSRRSFANYVYSNFSKPIAKKTILTIHDIMAENGIEFSYSNENSFPLANLVFRMSNKLRATYNSTYNVEDIDALNKLEKDYSKTKNKKEFCKNLFEIVNKYFPNFDKTVFNNYFDNLDDKQFDDSANTLIRSFKTIITGIGKLKTSINKKELALRKQNEDAWKEYRQKQKIWQNTLIADRKEENRPILPTNKYLDYNDIDLTPTIYSAILTFANEIVGYTESVVNLNSTNAEGSSASNVVKNCYITRFFDQILAETEEDSQAGLKALGTYLLQTKLDGRDNQYKHNPIFFGLRDENGVLIKDKSGYPIYPGMFTITDNGFEINPNAKELLRYNLFDGTQNTQEGNGNTYSKLSKLDFFLTQLYAFNKSTEEYTKIGRTTAVDGKETANYAMRIGADAPKIYFIRGPKFSKNECKYAIYNHVMNELTMFVNGISELFQQEENAVQDGEVKPFFRTRKDITPLIGRAFYDERVASEIKYNGGDDFTKAIVKDGKLVGNLFKFVRLFNLEGYNAGEQIEQLLSLYGGVDEKKLFTKLEDGGLMINQNDTIFHDGDKFVLNLSDEQKVKLKEIVSEWVDAFLAESKQDIAPLLESLNLYNVKYDIDSVDNFLLNYVNMNMCYDDFFEGDFKFYNSARDFLKRTKETQAGGDGYVGAPITDFLDTSTVKDLSWNNNKDVIQIESDTQFDENNNPILEDIIINGQKLIARTGFRGVTIYNTIKASDYADQLQKELEDNFIKQGISQEKAHKMSINIAKGYGRSASETIKGQFTKINDAQSYITLEEFIRRRYADGTIDEYKDLIKVLTDDTPIEKIDFDKINSRIQVQKNFYYDKVFDKDTGMFYPRQIKNAEFVLIPKLLPKDSQLRKIYDWMQKNDIGQLNTAETSKAAKKDIFTIWDPKTEQFDENFEEKFDEHYVENYDYRYLYEQQEVPQHMIDETNKAGLQITKKIIDNVISEIDENNPERKIVQTWADEYQEAFTENIEESFYLFLDNMGWAYDANNGKIINAEYETTDENGDPLSDEVIESNKSTLNFDNFYTRAREEAARVGMDNNFMEYLIPDEFGNPKMPNFMNSVSSKLQSIAQAIFNRRITRQTLPGWHAAQITGVGYSKHLEFDVKTGTMEVYLPRWSNLIPKGKTPEEDAEILKQIQEEGLDIHLGYRIPTEGKQSIAILKVVGFTNECLGSTIVVPNEWVTQTGADFDVDSIYGINYEIYATKDENGKTIVKKVPCTEEEFDEQRGYIRYVNTKLNAKVTKDKYGNEIKSKVKELRDSLNVQIKQERESENTKLSEQFNELDNSRNELYNRLPENAKWIIKDLNKTAKKEKRKRKDVKNEVTDLIDLYSRINSKLLELIENKKIEGENKELILEYIDYQNGIINVINAQQGLPVFNKEQYFSKKAELIDSIIQQAKIDYFNKVESAAKEAGLMDYDTWKQQPFIKKLDRRGRNNYIIDRMINIMKHESSREEQYGRSHFENILNGENGANDIIDKISNKSKKTFSPYNPISQLNYFDDSLGGAKLKALSVMWDTFLSKNNRIRASLSNNDAIDAIIELTPGVIKDSQVEYDIDEIQQSYDEDVYDYVEPKVKPIRTPKTVGYLNMDMSYYNNKRPTITAYTTFDAILNKERTATTRYNNLDYIKTFKVGDIIEIRNKDNRVCYVRITKCGFLDKNTSAEEWSKKEGWSVNYFNKKVKPIVEKGMAYQLEYELVDLEQLSDEECISTAKLDKNTSIKHNEIQGVGDKIKDYVLYTGTQYDGSFTKGGDSIFHDVATEYGLRTVGYSQRDMYALDQEKLEKIEKEYADETEWLGRTFIPINGKGGMLMRRDYLQAESADAIFAVAEILQPGDKNSKGFINTSKGPCVDGGTGYAVQFAIKMGKPIHVYRPSLRQWFTYDYNTKTYIPESTPALTPKFAGIGSRLVAENEDVKNEVRHLFETTKVGTGVLKNSITENEGIESAKVTIQTLSSDNNELSDEEKKVIQKELGNKPRVLVASEATDPVFHAAKIKKMVNEELAKPIGQRKFGMMYVITKHDGLPLRELAELKIPKFYHFSITSLGGTEYEPGVMKMDDLLDRIEQFIKEGLIKPGLVTIRIDPIIPGVTKAEDIEHIIQRGKSMGINNFRFSVMDSYGYTEGTKNDRFVVSKMQELGYEWEKYYDVKKGKYSFHPKQQYIDSIYSMMDEFAEKYKLNINTCGESNVTTIPLKRIKSNVGCINVESMNKAMGTTDISHVAGDQRSGCSCYGNKVDALTYNDKCASSCLYCYAKHGSDNAMQYYNEDGTLKDNYYTQTVKSLEAQQNEKEIVEETKEENLKSKKVLFKAKRLGYSNNNRNIVGNYVTNYSSQTTAHHLDAVKEGSVPNVNEYTFNVYKLLSSVGLDYEFVIGFMRQPIITKLVKTNNQINSIFFSVDENPITSLLIDTVKDITTFKGDNLYQAINHLKSDVDFTNKFNQLFNINISQLGVNEILNLKVPLDKARLFSRIERDANNKSNNWDKAFDFAMLLNFKQYAKIGDTINKIIRSTNADKYGSKPEISENRKTIEEIEELREDITLSRDGVSFINLIFPKDIYKEDLNINESSYKSIAAIYKYATVLSQQVNTKLFVTENEEFNIAEKEIEKLFGKRFNKNESKELRRYAIMTLYNQIEKLLTPLTLDKKGNIKVDTSVIEKTESEQNIAESYWDAERSRICGYGITTNGDFKIENVNKPTKKEIEQFKKLTPVQKVLFMQKNFPDEQGIFNCLNVTLLNPYDIKSKGVSRQYMSYNDQVYNIDDLIYLFSKAFTNHNPLIKLTAIDCIKYAFIAEGFNYKTGYITKLIPNDALYNGENEGGMDIISGQTLENNMKLAIHTLPETIITEEFKDNFVRSHHQFIKTIRMPKLPQKEIKNGESVYKFKNASLQFISNMRQDGLVYIDATDTDNLSSLINKLKINNKDYIKVCYPINDTKTNTTVYKVERTNPIYVDGDLIGYTDYFLIPLNLLDSSETYDYSYNANNNKWNSIEYYYDVINNISKIANEYRTNNTERKIKDIFNKSAKYKNKLEPVGAYTQNSVDLNLDSYGLMKLAEESDENTKRIVSRLVNGIRNHFANLEPGEITPYAQLHLNPLIAKLIPANSMVEQIIELPNGSEIEVQIGHLKMNEKNTQILKNRIAGKIKVEEYEEVIKDLQNSNTLPEKAQIYRVIPVKKDKKVIESNILSASTGLITGASTANPLARKRRDNIDIVSKQMMSEIKYDARKNKHNIAEQFVREMEYLHVNRNMSTSLESNRKNIYRAAAKYYTSAANEIINKVNKFKIVDDLGNEQEFSIDDPALYEALAENDQYFGEIAQLILNGITFGNRISEIFKLDITAEDIETKESIEKIINAINAVKQNKKLKDAMNNLINIYFKKYSTNPDIMRDIISLRETYGDLDVLDAWIADPTDIDNNEVQVILKKVYGMFAKAEMFDVERNIKEYKDEIERIKAMSGSLDINKVINFDNMSIRQDFTEDFLVQKEAVKDRLTEARKHKDENLEAYKQYVLAKYERDKFMYENTEQSIIEDYYAQDLKLRADVIRNADDSYFKYMQITEEIRNLNESNLTEEEKNEKRKLLFNKINELRSEVDIITGTPKSMREIAKAKALNEYIEAKSKLQEKYFESQEYEGFQETYKRYKEYIDKYNSEFFYKSLSEKLEDSKYREAYDWIRTNGKLKFAENERKKLQNAFKILNGGKTSINKTILNSLKKLPGVVDENGNINPLNLTEAQIKYIKDQEESDLAKFFENGLGEAILIKDVPSDITLIKTPNDKEGKAIFKLNSYDPAKTAKKRELIGEINEILKKVVDKDTGRLNMQLLFNDAVVSDEERIKLSNLYNELGKLNKKRFKKRKNKVFEDEIDEEAFLRAFSFYKTKLKGTKYESQFLNIFTIIDETGSLVANPLIYGYMVPNDEYIDYEKTEALDYIRDNVDFVTTEYYEQAKQQAISQGQEAFDKWFKLNHVYNPYTHKYDPLKIWTTIDAKPGSELAASITYFPSFQNRERFVKPEFINNKANRTRLGIDGNGYQEFGNNYKTTHKTHDGRIVNNKFNSNLNLNDKERALRNHLINTLNKHATTYQGKRFVGQGYLPRERQNEITGKYIAGQLGALLGMSWHSGADSDNFHDTVDYSHDREATFDMLTLIKGKGTKKYESAPERGDMSIEEYEKKLEEVREKNKQIKKENEEIDKKLVNRDWETVMEHFVHNATIFNSRQAAKPYLYLLLEDLAHNNAYMIKGIWNRRVIKNKETSTDDDVQYRTIKQERTYEIIHNLARRLLFDQYHENHPFRPVMNFLQNLTSAKYMVFNVYGGVANVLTGKVNIAREAYAKEYFGFKEYREAELRYLQSIPSMTAYAYSEKANNITDALIKKFHVVDYDQMLQFGEGSKGLDETLRKIRNGTYAFQSCGEHYMQNTVLLAMLNTNKLYIDRNGVQRIGSLHDFTWDVEQQALEQVLSEYPDLLINYENYLDNIKYDVEEKLKIDSGRLDFNRKYLNSLKNYEDAEVSGKYKEINQKYNETRKKLLDERKKEFIANKDTVESLFEFKDGKAVLKQEAINNFNAKGKNKIGDLHTLVAEFREKVISVNKKIHGVYDKNGAAQIEKKWFGSVLMQYHKHLWTNIMKRWRRKGYFSEFRGTKEYGSYQSVIDFLGTEFIDMKSSIKKKTENGENIMLASIQVAMQGALNTVMSIQSNYKNLPTWQKANIRRNIAEIAGILVACAIVLALYGTNDDDEIKDDVFKSSLLYIADRLYSETSMYTPVGLVTESKTLYSSPIASANGPSDLLKMVTIIPQALFDPDYNPNYQTGQYAGRNKFEVLFRRNIPGVRPYDRIQFITKNNKYYKIGNSHIGINLAKTFGESIND